MLTSRLLLVSVIKLLEEWLKSIRDLKGKGNKGIGK